MICSDSKRILEIIKEKPDEVMSTGYLNRWNKEEQARIDRDIAAHRMADAALAVEGLPSGTPVRVEQLSHEFVFGSHIFNFDQLGSDECNARYKELYGTLFNSATIAFYWRKFELEEGKPRFAPEYRDSAEFWNSVKEPKQQPHWRRPATDPVVDFCESKGIRLHGHTFVWGNYCWHYPDWVVEKLPAVYRASSVPSDDRSVAPRIEAFEGLSVAQIEALVPEYAAQLHTLMAKRIFEIALRYKGRIHSWDVVNESATDFGRDNIIPGDGLCKSWYGLMPGDYPYRAFKIAEAALPGKTLFNINDYLLTDDYVREVEDLKNRGCKVDVMGAQMHLFDPQTCQDIADGKSDEQSPVSVRATMEILAKAQTPVHLSEVTITSPGGDDRGGLIQAIIARNLYRLWFSLEPLMGITWWNAVDGCGAPGEPSVSGLFTRAMQPKPAYFALNDLINNEWKTRLTVQAGDQGSVKFRGFFGKYRLSWKDAAGNERTLACELSKTAGFRPLP